MSLDSPVLTTHHFFIGTDRDLEFTCYVDDDKEVCRDVTGVALRWVLRKQIASKSPLVQLGPKVLEKSSGSGITVVGVFNATPEDNTQRVLVSIKDTDTLPLKAGDYDHALKDDTPDAEDVLAFGTFALLTQAAL